MAAKQKILIVDDDNNIAELISLYLTKECFDTMIVHDGEEALTAFESYQPNLMLLDLMLPGIDGYTLGEKFREHAEQLGAKFENVEVDHIEQTAEGFTVFCKEGEPLQSRTILCASGTSYRRLDVPGGTLQGVSYCATCDGAFYKDKIVAVIGGGDTALGDAMYLSRMAKKVYLVHRRQEFPAKQA